MTKLVEDPEIGAEPPSDAADEDDAALEDLVALEDGAEEPWPESLEAEFECPS